MYKLNLRKWYWVLILLAGFDGPALGQVTIDQAKANAGGVTPGDAAGFPVTLSRPGSYLLTGNLNVPNVNTTAIDVSADNVNIDLGGFTIRGPVTCSGKGESLKCAPNGFGRGVNSGQVSGTVVRNGTVQGMGIGLALGSAGTTSDGANRVENVTVRNSFSGGISMNGGIVTGCVLINNGDDGLNTDTGIVINNIATANQSEGFSIGIGTFIDNVANSNGFTGLFSTRLPIGVGYINNVLSGNGFADVTGSLLPIQFGANLCSGSPCP